MKRRFKFSLAVAVLTVLLPGSLQAKDVKERPRAKLDSVAYHGCQLGVNLVQGGMMAFGDKGSIDVHADVNLFKRFQPCLEFGYARANQDLEQTGQFSGKGFFLKTGLDIPISSWGPDADNQFFGGVRYAYSPFRYHLLNQVVPGEEGSPDTFTDYANQLAHAHWLEVALGVRVQIVGPLYMGWTAKWKRKLAINEEVKGLAPFVPGFGTTGKSNLSFAFHVYYRLPW